MTKANLEPVLTLGDIYGPDLLYNARAPEGRNRWLLQDRFVRDALTVNLLTAAGEITTLCSRAALTSLSRDILSLVGLEVGPFVVFDDPKDYQARLLEESRSRKVVIHHVHNDQELPAERYWIERELLSRLNDKAFLSELVPVENVPDRFVYDTLPGTAELPFAVPLAMKAGTTDSSAGGFGVRICRSADDIETARRELAGAPKTVVEKLIVNATSVCMHYGVDRAGTVTWLGGAEQIFNERGNHAGNWLGTVDIPDAAIEIGRRIMERAWERGYFGLAGLDVLFSDDGRIMVVDLNFRVNSSTLPALLWPSIERHWGSDAVARSRRWRLPEGIENAAPRIKAAVDDGFLIPLSIADPRATYHGDVPAYFHGLLVGRSRGEVLVLEQEFDARSFSPSA